MDQDNNPQKKRGCLHWVGLITVVYICVQIFRSCIGGVPDYENDRDSYPNNRPTFTMSETAEGTSAPESTGIAEEGISFVITGGTQGEYGKLITYNAGTEFAEEFYAYYVPVGEYEVKNTREYPAQVNVYSNEKAVNEDGWEEPAEVFEVKLIGPRETAEISVGEGQHVEINDGEILQFTSKPK